MFTAPSAACPPRSRRGRGRRSRERLLAHHLRQVSRAVTGVEGTTSASVCLNRACSRLARVRSHTTCSEWPPPAAHPGTTATTTLGIVRIRRCTSRMCSRPPAALTRAGRRCRRSRRRRTGSHCGRGSAGRRRSRTPSPVLGRRPVAGQQHAPDIGCHPGMVQRPVQLVDRVRAERVAHLRPVEGDPNRAAGRTVDHRPVVRDVGELEPSTGAQAARVEELGDGTSARIGAWIYFFFFFFFFFF